VLSEKQKMDGLNIEADVFGYYFDDEYVSIQVFHLRDGKLIERNGFLYDKIGNEQDIIREFIIQFYVEKNNPLPLNIMIPNIELDGLEDVINHKILIPKRGKNLEMVNLVCENAKNKVDELLKKKRIEFDKTKGALSTLEDLLDIRPIK